MSKEFSSSHCDCKIRDLCIISIDVDVSYFTGTRNLLTWDVIEKDPRNMFNGNNPERINILSDGLYEIKAYIPTNGDPVAADIHWLTIFRKQGTVATPIASDARVPSGVSYSSLSITRLIRLEQDEYVYLEYGNNTGVSMTVFTGPTLASLNSGLSGPFFSVVKLSN